MFIKIYFNDKPLFLCDEFTAEINSYVHHDDSVFIDEFSAAAVNSMIHEMKQNKVHAGIFYHPKMDELKKAFWRKFVIVKAGGGLVQNENKDALFIRRRNKWDLPKGKLDKGESLEECAIREVKEETGLKKIELSDPLLITYHTYDENGKHYLKETHWYGMKSSNHETPKPQQEEQITEIAWADQGRILNFMKDSFPSVRDVIEAGGYLVG